MDNIKVYKLRFLDKEITMLRKEQLLTSLYATIGGLVLGIGVGYLTDKYLVDFPKRIYKEDLNRSIIIQPIIIKSVVSPTRRHFIPAITNLRESQEERTENNLKKIQKVSDLKNLSFDNI